MFNFASMELILKVSAQLLVKGAGTALPSTYTIQLMDKDPLKDDLLGSTSTDRNGKVYFQVNPNDFQTVDSFAEKLPDLYLSVLEEGKEIFRTPVANDVDVLQDGHFNSKDGASIHLGTFLVPVAEEA
jgi:hypothetical protein